MSFSREFERASVRVSCETGEGTIETKLNSGAAAYTAVVCPNQIVAQQGAMFQRGNVPTGQCTLVIQTDGHSRGCHLVRGAALSREPPKDQLPRPSHARDIDTLACARDTRRTLCPHPRREDAAVQASLTGDGYVCHRPRLEASAYQKRPCGTQCAERSVFCARPAEMNFLLKAPCVWSRACLGKTKQFS